MHRSLSISGPKISVVACAVVSLTLLGIALGDGGCTSSVAGSAPPPCPLPAGMEDDFCAALAAYHGRCGHCDDCTGKNLQKCTKRGSTISTAYRAAFIACRDTMPCDADPSFSKCIEERMKSAVPTPAQIQAKDAYCAACNATNAADCANFFVVLDTSGKNGAGYNLLLSADQTVTRAVTLCSSKCNAFDYGLCVAFTSCADSGGDFCVDSGFCAPR